MRSFTIPWLVVIATLVAACGPRAGEADAPRVTVFAAASTAVALRTIADRFEDATGIEVALSADASSRLARQIEAGAPADVFLSANRAWMDHLEAAGAIRAETRRDLLANSLVLVAPVESDLAVDPDLAVPVDLDAVRRLALGDPDHVPAGRYARQALESLGWWETLAPRVVPTLDVRAALRLVEIGEADAGIVYATDAAASTAVRVVAAIPEDGHDPIRYPVAACRAGAEAESFLDFLAGSEARRILVDAGFRLPGAGRGGA